MAATSAPVMPREPGYDDLVDVAAREAELVRDRYVPILLPHRPSRCLPPRQIGNETSRQQLRGAADQILETGKTYEPIEAKPSARSVV
jgi:hypothetical protein